MVTSAGGTVWINDVNLTDRLRALQQALARHVGQSVEPSSVAMNCVGGLHPDRAFVGRRGAHLILNATVHGCVLLDGVNVMAKLEHIESLLALL